MNTTNSTHASDATPTAQGSGKKLKKEDYDLVMNRLKAELRANNVRFHSTMVEDEKIMYKRNQMALHHFIEFVESCKWVR